MNIKKFVAIIVLLSNGVYCYIPHGDSEYSTLTKTVPFQQPSELNVRPVYDPGVDKTKSVSTSFALPQLIPDSDFISQPNDMSNSIFDDDLPNSQDAHTNTENNNNNFYTDNVLENLRDEIKNDENIAIKSAILLKLLEDPSSSLRSPLPVLYVEDDSAEPIEEDFIMNKRSGRYYRRYPWKRQNTRSRSYDPESRYLCVPSREDVYKLLVGLHENRNGNHQKTVHFCNRKRPAKAIFTNIRFLG